MKYLIWAISVIALAFNAGCLVPEKFENKIIINCKEDKLVFIYKGNMVHVPYRENLLEDQSDEKKDKEDIQVIVNKLKENKNVKNASYAGNAEFNLDYEFETKISGLEENPFIFFNEDLAFINIVKDNNKIIILSAGINQQVLDELKTANINFQGEIVIEVIGGVVEVSNAPEVDSNKYTWKFNNKITEPVDLVVKINE